MGEEEQGSVSVSAYDMMASWFTPSYLFIFINLVIGTIAITSRFANPRKQKQPDSPVQRVTSFGLGSYKFEPEATEETRNQTVAEPVQNQEPTQIHRAPSLSLLDRVKSINLGLYKTEDPTPDEPTRNQLARAPSLLERMMSVTFHRLEEKKPESGSEPEVENMHGRGEEEGVDAKADDFIKRFKQQLRLERLDSILRYRDILQRK